MFEISSFARPVIVGFSSTALTTEEKNLFKESKPAGFILFKRNCESFEQVKNLVVQLKETVGFNCPILIDQEGGRISRLKTTNGFEEFPAPKTFLNKQDVYNNAARMALQLKYLGISVNCTPLCDLLFPETHDIIGDRSFGEDPAFVAEMASSVMKAHFDQDIMPVIKHLPGHGRAVADSHETLPIVNTPHEQLEQTDFKAFKMALQTLKDEGYPSPWGMTAHILYQSIDAKNCATQSKIIISDVIRNYIGFSGLLLSDCITMKALKGTYLERIQKSLDAGCHIALHCSGIFSEIEQILKQ
jgi:beta-N-acetylhexosaminidase